MFKMSHFLLFLCLSVVTSCEQRDDDDQQALGSVELNFKSVYGDAPLVMYADEYDYQEGMKIKLQLFQFFISNIRLIDEDGKESKELLDVALVSFEDIQNTVAASEGIAVSLDGIPAGNYQGIRMGIGVKESLNGTSPSDYQAGHPLSGHYWSAASSYVFTKIEGNADLEGDGVFSEKLTFHVGGNGRYRDVDFMRPITIGSDPAALEFSVDLEQVLVDEEESLFVDFREVTQIHNGTAETAVFIMDNLAASINLR